jgi:ABC-type anion transport system duplicated permease subunit
MWARSDTAELPFTLVGRSASKYLWHHSNIYSQPLGLLPTIYAISLNYWPVSMNSKDVPIWICPRIKACKNRYMWPYRRFRYPKKYPNCLKAMCATQAGDAQALFA